MSRTSTPWAALIIGGGVVAGLVAAVAVIVPRFPTSYTRPTCLRRVERLAKAYVERRRDGRFRPELHGPAQVVSWVAPIPTGDEMLFICPGDQYALVPDTPEGRARYDVPDLRQLEPLTELVSYAVRDFERFPVAADDETAWILCDRQGPHGRNAHHRDGLVVGFADGSSAFLTRAELGLAPGEPIVVGAASVHPELRKLE